MVTLYRSKSEPPSLDGDRSSGDWKRRKKNKKKKSKKQQSVSIIPEDHHDHSSHDESPVQVERSCVSYAGELRQMNVSGENGSLGCFGDGSASTVSFLGVGGEGSEEVSPVEKENKANGEGGDVAEGTASSGDSREVAKKGKLETAESLDWKKLMAEDPISQAMALSTCIAAHNNALLALTT